MSSHLTPQEEAELRSLAALILPVWEPLDGPQRMAYESKADIIGYGGAAGGGKTDLACGLAITKHKRALIVRREKAQTEGIIQRLQEILGTSDGYNSQKGIWKVGNSRLLEFAGLDNPGDERRWQGRPHDLKVYDEVTEQREAQVRFTMGWLRSADPSVDCKVLMTFNPPTTVEGRWVLSYFGPWLDKNHPRPALPGELRWFTTEDGRDVEVPDNRPYVRIGGERVYDFDKTKFKAEQIITPKSRTFIPARVTDNPYYMESGYMSTLQALPEPLRSQMLNGDFNAGVEDDPWQLLPTAWVQAAMDRWTDKQPRPPMDGLGVDVARGGKDKSIWVSRHGQWYARPTAVPGEKSPDGPSVAGQTMALHRDGANIYLDVIGVGASPYDFLVERGQPVIGVDVRRASKATDKSGMLTFFNLRSELGWKFRELLDPANNIAPAIPPDPELLRELCGIKWGISGKTIKVESREDIINRIGHSPDHASAFFLAAMDYPKNSDYAKVGRTPRRAPYDPFENITPQPRADYDPFKNL